MALNVRHVVLHTIDLIGGRPNGKTYVQKLCYFVHRLTGESLGFRAHYYGPYSDQVAAELSFLTGAGLLTEARRASGMARPEGWEVVRYDYSLTKQGSEAIVALTARQPVVAGRIRNAVTRAIGFREMSYVDLSFAAKTDWILQADQGPMTPEGVARAASRFNWNVSDTDVQRAALFLSRLGLVRLQ